MSNEKADFSEGGMGSGGGDKNIGGMGSGGGKSNTLGAIKVIKAEWDLRPKTKFLMVEGYVMVDSFNDKVITSIAEPQGINQNILLISVIVESSGGPKKRQPSTFYLREMTIGDEPWTHIQVVYGTETDTIPITKLDWAGEVDSISDF